MFQADDEGAHERPHHTATYRCAVRPGPGRSLWLGGLVAVVSAGRSWQYDIYPSEGLYYKSSVLLPSLEIALRESCIPHHRFRTFTICHMPARMDADAHAPHARRRTLAHMHARKRICGMISRHVRSHLRSPVDRISFAAAAALRWCE